MWIIRRFLVTVVELEIVRLFSIYQRLDQYRFASLRYVPWAAIPFWITKQTSSAAMAGGFFMTAQWCFVYLAKITVAVFLGFGPKIIH